MIRMNLPNRLTIARFFLTLGFVAALSGDWQFGHNIIAEAGVHDAVANQHGAVSVVLADGKLLGVKPDEFERVQ